MKIVFLFFVLGFTLGLQAAQKISLDQVFVIKHGFDDNDDVQIVVDGKLPNVCYRLSETKTAVDTKTKKIVVEQYAELSEFSACTASALPDHLTYAVSFSKEISLGKLQAGEYEVVYQIKPKTFATEKFFVTNAPVNTVDDKLYAPVAQAIIPEMIYETSNAEVILSGIFYSGCLALNSTDIKVLREGNVVIILPYLTVYDNSQCDNKSAPLHKILNIGAFQEGRYLLHIRSLSGRAVNKTFTVVKKENDFGNGLPYLDLSN
jgi:hypothetical protein